MSIQGYEDMDKDQRKCFTALVAALNDGDVGTPGYYRRVNVNLRPIPRCYTAPPYGTMLRYIYAQRVKLMHEASRTETAFCIFCATSKHNSHDHAGRAMIEDSADFYDGLCLSYSSLQMAAEKDEWKAAFEKHQREVDSQRPYARSDGGSYGGRGRYRRREDRRGYGYGYGYSGGYGGGSYYQGLPALSIAEQTQLAVANHQLEEMERNRQLQLEQQRVQMEQEERRMQMHQEEQRRQHELALAQIELEKEKQATQRMQLENVRRGRN